MKNKTQKLIPIGYIHGSIKSYYLIKPRPLERDWEDDMFYRFSVVPFGTTPDHISHQCPREVVFACDFLVEYATDIPTIECEVPYDILDIEDEIITTEYENSLHELAKKIDEDEIMENDAQRRYENKLDNAKKDLVGLIKTQLCKRVT